MFDHQALRDFPNAVPKVDGKDTRRSDMIWSLLNRFAGGRDVLQSSLPVRQERNVAPDMDAAFSTLAQDIQGFAVCSAVRMMLERRKGRGRRSGGRGFLDLDQEEIQMAMAAYRRSRAERLAAFSWNFARIAGLVSAISKFCVPGSDTERVPWWLSSTGHDEAAARLRKFWTTLKAVYTPERLADFQRQVTEIDDATIHEYFLNLGETAGRHRAMTALPVDRIRSEVESRLRWEFRVGPLDCLGVGEEGAIFTDGHLVYKYFHYWKPGTRDRKVEHLQSLVGRVSGYRTLPDIQEVRQWGEHVALVYTYEAGSPYVGGHLEDILSLMRECRAAGLACRNIHPDNLLVTPSGLKLIDIGADIVPYDGNEFEQMCRRALLTYRFHFRSDLKALMTRSLDEPDLPELVGLEQFRRAVDPRGVHELLHRPLAAMVTEHKPETVLDYGCGNGELAELLVSDGLNITAYDPDAGAVASCSKRGMAVECGGPAMLERLREDGVRYDAVVCSRVLCTIGDADEVEGVLADLRRLVSDQGQVWVAVCNPFYYGVATTELNTRPQHADREYHETFTYPKAVAPHGNVRVEVHRSLSTYRHAFAKAGLRIVAVRELDGADVCELRPASEHLVFELRPVSAEGPNVSLLIKTCYMEWRTIERFVRHQVAQLEEPTRFAEKVVMVDPSPGPFLRQYEEPDAEAHRIAMERLLRDGVVDRVVYAPEDPATIRGTYRKWFGAESTETHSASGQQLFATLYGFDACIGDYVLQLDSDLLIHRDDAEQDFLNELVGVLQDDPKALFVPLSICRSDPLPYTHQGPNGNWRVEVRGCMFDRRRLQSVLPIANDLEAGRFAMGWHRAFDRFIAGGEFRSYRGGVIRERRSSTCPTSARLMRRSCWTSWRRLSAAICLIASSETWSLKVRWRIGLGPSEPSRSFS